MLSLVMFTIFTNDLSEVTKDENFSSHENEDDFLFRTDCIKCRITPAYTDDATHIIRSRTRDTNQQNLSNNLQAIANYLESNQLSVNQGKMQLMESMVHQKRTRLLGNIGRTVGSERDEKEARQSVHSQERTAQNC